MILPLILTLLSHQIADMLEVPQEIVQLEPFPAGVCNEVYLVDAKSYGKWVAKIFKKISLDQVLGLEKSAMRLRNEGFSLPQSFMIGTYNNHPLQISEYIHGEHIKRGNLTEVAALLARLHLIPPLEIKSPDTRKAYTRCLFKDCKRWAHTKGLKKIYKSIDQSYFNKLPLGLIHGDFSPSNLLKNGDHPITMIDLDQMSTSYLLTDIATTLIYFGFDQKGAIQEEDRHAFLEAYNTLRPMTCLEREKLNAHMTLILIEIALEMYCRLEVTKDLKRRDLIHTANRWLLPESLVKKIYELTLASN